jgi:hypothetical protein
MYHLAPRMTLCRKIPVLLLLVAVWMTNCRALQCIVGNTRRKIFEAGGAASIAAVLLSASARPSVAAETVGKDKDCNDSTCLGVWDGLLADCPHKKISTGGAGCTSSQDDTPGIFSEPWDYSESSTLDWEAQMRLLVPTIQLVSSRRGDKADVLMKESRYLRVLFTDFKTGEKSIGEFYLTPNDTTVQFRVASLASGSNLFSSSLKNIDRAEAIRKELRYLKVPVLRNRRRTLLFVESELDSFGPGSSALGPPAEMSSGELEGRQDVDPKLKIDILQSFPLAK